MKRGTTNPSSCRRPPGALHLLAALLLPAALLPRAHAQVPVSNPVYLDDAPAVEDGLVRARELAASGNLDEAVRVLQALLSAEGDRVTPSRDPQRPDLYVPVRARIHDILLGSPALLARYRDAQSDPAQRLLDAGDAAAAERERLLTTPGLRAALIVAQRRLERAQFWGAFHALEQLERHPDRTGQAANDDLRARAASLLARVARYLDDPAVWARAEQWAREAAIDAPHVSAREPIEGPDIPVGASPLDPARPVEFQGLLSKPLWSEALSGETGALDRMPDPEPLGEGQPYATAQTMSVVPTVAGDTIYLNTGAEVSAWDRLTLTPRWPRRKFSNPLNDPAQGFAGAGRNSQLQDGTWTTVWNDWLLIVAGEARAGRREGDARVHALDARTGEPRWSADPAQFDPLMESWARGPVLIDQGVAVLAVVKQSQQRRLASVQLVGLDLATGEPLWRRPLGSAGALPYGQSTEAPDTGAVLRGVLYRSDRVGVVSAVETATGRVRWAFKAPPESFGRSETLPWEAHTPVLTDDAVHVLSPDRRRVLALDADTGALRASIDARALGNPQYLLRAADALVAVEGQNIRAVPLPMTGDERNAWTVATLERPFVRGRVVPAGDRLLIPSRNGLLVADLRPPPGRDPAPPRALNLDRPGLVLPLPDQLVVVDDWQVHTYLLWEVAERMLADRIDADPTDPTPAVTYAELAYRAGKPDAILAAADIAIRAIRAAPDHPRSEGARKRLFRTALTMLEQEPGAAPQAPMPDNVAAGLVERLGALAHETEERVAFLMASGADAESRDNARAAIDAYQAVLLDPTLAAATLTRRGVSSRADIEATRRLRRVVREHGPSPYAPFEAEAQRALDALAANPSPNAEPFEQLAATYPVSQAAAAALLRASDAHAAAGSPDRATIALENALLAASDALARDPALVGEIGGRLVKDLLRAGHLRAAAATLARLAAERPGLVFTDRGVPIDAPSLARELDQRLAQAERKPRVGPLSTDRPPQPLSGWIIAETVTSPAAPPPAHVALARNNGELALFAPAETGGVEPLWKSPPTPGLKLLRVQQDALYLSLQTDPPPNARPAGALPAAGGRNIVRIDPAVGPSKPLWTTDPFRTLFLTPNPDAPADPRLQDALAGRTVPIYTPLEGPKLITELLAVFDERTVALVERSGRAAAFDLDTGKTLWTQTLTVPRVHDAAAAAGVLAIGGSDLAPPNEDDRLPGAPLAVAIDLRTGRILHRETQIPGQVRWVRVTPRGRPIVGADTGVVCIDPFQARSRWRQQSPAARATINAWTFPGRVIVMDEAETLWQIDEDDGAVRERSLDARGRIPRARAINTYAVLPDNAPPGDELAVFATPAGLTIFSRTGELVGIDARADARPVVPAVHTEAGFLTVDAAADGLGFRRDGDAPPENTYTVRLNDPRSAALLAARDLALAAEPFAIAALDGRVLVSAGDLTVVYDAPVPPPPAPPPSPAASAAPAPAP